MQGAKQVDNPNFERIYWEKARRSFKEGRKDKDDEKKLDEFLKERSTPQETRELCKSTQKKAGNEYSPSLGGILEKIDIAMSFGDLAVKSAPESVGLAWMGIRLCLHAVADDFATFNIFGAACSDIIGIMISCAVFGKMYGPSRGIDSFQEFQKIQSQVTDRIPFIYTEILDFSFSVKKYMGRNKAARWAKGVVISASAKFGMKIQAIKEHDMAMAEFARRAHEQLSDHYLHTAHDKQQEMRGSLDEIRDKLNHSAKLDEAYRQQVRLLIEELGKRKEMTPHDVSMKNFNENVKALDAISDQQGIYNAKLKRRSPPETCTWIFGNEAFKAWFESEKSDMLWVSGGGGFGKSILMAAVVKELHVRSQDKGALVQYFFCNAGDDTTKRTERILKHLLYQIYQLVSQHPTETIEKSNKLVSSYLKASKSTKSGQGESKKENVTFGDAFRGIVVLLGQPAYIIVDALDECTDRSEGLVASLRELVEEALPMIKVVVCSRPEVEGLDQISTIKVEGNNGPDIKLNAETELARLPSFTAHERELATDKIVEKAGSYFRYVDLAIGFLKQPWQRPLKKHLEQLPEGLEAFYEQIIKKTDPAYLDLLKTCLTWAILADGKVHVAEVTDVYSRAYMMEDEDAQQVQELGPDFESPTSSEKEKASDQLFVAQIRTAGSALLDVDNKSKVIQLRHNTVADHFLKAPSHSTVAEKINDSASHCETCRKAGKTADKFIVTEKQGHLAIATAILKHLTNETFRRRHLVLLERIELKRRFEGQPDGYVQDEEIQEDLENEKSEKEIDADMPMKPPHAVHLASHEHDDGSDVNEPKQDRPASVEGSASESNVTSEEAGESSADTSSVKPEDDAASDAASEDSDDVADIDYMYSSTEDDGAQLYRYEVTYCAHHLRRVEELFETEDRTSPEWWEFEALRTTFFQDGSPYFRSWVNLLNQIRYGELSWIDDVHTIHPIHVAASNRLTSLVKQLLRDGADLTRLTDEGYTPLDFAIEYYAGAQKDLDNWYANSIELFKVLLEAGANVNAISIRMSRAPFYQLFYYNPSLEVVQLFLDHGADLHKQASDSRSSILHVFCSVCDNADVLRELLRRGAKLDAVDQAKETPLHSLMQRFEGVPVELVEILIEAGANVSDEDDLSQQPLRELCVFNGSSEAAELLIKAGADVLDEDLSRQTALHIAAENGHVDIVRLLIEKRAKIDAMDDRGCTPLYKACGAKSDDSALYMIHHAEDINKRANNGKTPLQKAAARGHRKIVEAIFEKCNRDVAVLTNKDNRERTPLHAAAQYGRKDVVEYLLQQGVSVTVQDNNGKTPLRACFDDWSEARTTDYEAICVLLLGTAQITELDAGLLHVAAARGSLLVVKELMNRGADPLAQDEHGWTSIQIAQQFRKEEAVDLLSTTRAVTGFPPSELRNTLPKLFQLSDDRLEVKNSSIRMQSGAILAQHPVPAGASSFYFEIVIDASLRKDNETTEPASTDLVRYGHEDVIGCGLDVRRDKIFFTKNGELFELEKLAKLTHYAFTGVTGRLYPVIGISNPGVKVKVNFGNDTTSMPFAWKPGNEADNGTALVNEKEESLARKPLLRRRTTQAVIGAREGEDTVAGAATSPAIVAPAGPIEATAKT
ncbi:uncharacterized protein N0V89_003559 [Didymosphaeria variabile]|uniref:Protein SSH4 n=1 Tax=Didymosphaeria variabile TaxID=1932322 RepID=A0A9W9CCM4_9PLEO|nr:uncharacterized protein N0V89_003559 [Didymosphaeria variabile]KAJ4355542.1 hypothetical protein N0V89_003559 [Didymosphaeria variabile]